MIRIFTVLIFFVFLAFSQLEAVAQFNNQNKDEKSIPKNTISAEAVAGIVLTYYLKYEHILLRNSLSDNWQFELAPMAGVGLANQDHLDEEEDHRYALAGAIFALQFRSRHQLETNLFLLLERSRTGYLTTVGEQWEMSIRPKINIAYRIEWEFLSFRISVNPTYDDASPRNVSFWPGLGLGVRF